MFFIRTLKGTEKAWKDGQQLDVNKQYGPMHYIEC